MTLVMAKHYGKVYKANSREDIRKESVQPLCNGAVAFYNTDDSERATNSGKFSYSLTDEALEVIQAYGSTEWSEKLDNWLEDHETLVNQYSQVREMAMIPVKINGKDLRFSPGKHINLQKAIIEEFAPRFAPGAEVLYVGDTAKKDLYKNRERIQELGVKLTKHGHMIHLNGDRFLGPR